MNQEQREAVTVRLSGSSSVDDEHPDPAVRELARKAIQATAAIKAKMSPPGALNLPPLLDERRLEHGIVDGVFRGACLFERVLVYQIDREQSELFEGASRIVRPPTVRQREERTSSLGIVVGAGLRALDVLRSNGVDLGHVVQIIKNAPWRIQVDTVNAQPVHVIVLNAGDILCSLDLGAALIRGAKKIREDINDQGMTEHSLTTKPLSPWMSEDI